MNDIAITNAFHEVWYPHQRLWWMGVDLQKCPMDLIIYQEIIHAHRPDWIIECGTWHGGSALYLANLCDLLGHGRIITIDIEHWGGLPTHSRITYVTGSSTDEAIVGRIANQIHGNVMVILDSDHMKEHVLRELELYSPLVTEGQYLIVEDSNIHGHPVRHDLPPGPFEAIEEWLPSHPDFTQDRERERLLLSFNPGGYLRRTNGTLRG